MINKNGLVGYREGHVIKETLDNLYCCHIAEVTKPVLDYIELIYEDGNRRYIYEDVEAFSYVEKDFVSKRFTSFFELFTTDELAIEDRGFAQFEYYLRRGDEAYTIMKLEAARGELENNKKLPDRIAKYAQYDTKVDYHMNC